MKITNISRKISTPVLAFAAGCLPVETTGYSNIGTGALKPESRKITAQVSCELGAETLFDNERKIKTGVRYRYLPHPKEKKQGVTVDVDSHLYSFVVGMPLVDQTRFKLGLNAEAGVTDTRGELSTEVEAFPGVGLTLKEDYQETSGFLGGNMDAEYRLTKDISIFVQPEALYVFGDDNGFLFGGGTGFRLRF